jgi:hypothetical protein
MLLLFFLLLLRLPTSTNTELLACWYLRHRNFVGLIEIKTIEFSRIMDNADYEDCLGYFYHYRLNHH